MKKTSKILSIILAILMMVSIIPITASAATYSGTCGDNLTWTFDDSTGTLTISGEGDMYDYTSSNRPWQDYVKKIKKIVMNEGITSIGDYAFYKCNPNILFIFAEFSKIPNSVTKIGEHAFDNCTLIDTLDNPNITSIGAYAFANCNMKTIVISDAVTIIEEYTFYYSSSRDLEHIVIGKGVKKVETNAFTGCNTLDAVFYAGTEAQWNEIDWYTIEDEDEYYTWDYMTMFYEYKNESVSGKCGDNLTWTYHLPTRTLTVSGTGPMYDCTASRPLFCYYLRERVASVVIEEGVTTIGERAFADFYALYNVTLPDSLTSIGYYAFYDCGYIQEIIIPDNVTFISKAAFFDCSGIKNIVIGDGLTTINDNTFGNNKTLETLTIGKSVSSISGTAFAGCSDLSTITVHEENQYLTNDEYGALFNKSKTNLLWFPTRKIVAHYEIPDTVTVISAYAFDNCQYLGGVTIPDSVNTIGAFAFRNCKKLTSIVIPDSVKKLGGGVFNMCNYLESATLPSGLTSIPAELFYNCGSLKSIMIPDGVTEIGYSAFYGCNKFTEIVIPDSVTEIKDRAFENCYRLETVKFGKNLKEIYSHAFEDCTELKSIVFPEGFIKDNQETFAYCRKVQTVFIPSTAKYLGHKSFYGCSNITDVYYAGTEIEWQNIVCTLKEEPHGSRAKFHFNAFVSASGAFAVLENENVIPKKSIFSSEILETTDNSMKFDISFTNGETEIQPNGNVSVRIPVPSDMDTNGLSVYREEDNGSYTNMNAVYENGYMIFTTDHFSVYILSYEKPECLHKTTTVINVKEPTCTETGYNGDVQCTVCEEIIESLGETSIMGHEYESVVTSPTCTEKGYTTYTCECGDSYVADYVNALGHTPANAAEENYVAPTCTENGSKDVVVYCSACDEELNRETVEIEILDHVDENNDGYCDDCDFQICDHKCHKGGFFWKLTLFFNKLFKSNKYCSCGVAHY